MSYSTGNQIATIPQDNEILVQVTLARLIKANQAFIEIKHRRLQISQYEEMVHEKDRVIRDLLKAAEICHKVNVEYQEKEKNLNQKALEYQNLTKDYKLELRKSKNQKTFLKFGTTFITIGVGIGAGVGGYYIAKLTQ